MTTATEKAAHLVQNWTNYAIGKPITLTLTRLGILVAEAIDAAEQAAYERGLRTGIEFADREPAQQIEALVALAGQAGARGTWLLRGIATPDLIYNVPGDDGLPTCLTIHPPCELLLIARFPTSDGGQPGIQYYQGGNHENPD